jgi:hypothetical protein
MAALDGIQMTVAKVALSSMLMRGRSIMSASSLFAVSTALALLSLSAAAAAGVSVPRPASAEGQLLVKVHSVYEAERTLYRRGYYDVRLERPSLPYSFNACKRGVRYHVHMDYYGDLVQVDPIGRCYEAGYAPGYDGPRPYYRPRPYYERYREPY